jgi:hypothetical protein
MNASPGNLFHTAAAYREREVFGNWGVGIQRLADPVAFAYPRLMLEFR